jgi:hypothetical protein
MLKIGYEQARDLLELAVEERGPDYVYEHPDGETGGCFYFTRSGEPSCIVGWVLNRLGLKFEWGCATTTEDHGYIPNATSVEFLIAKGHIDVDFRTAVLLQVAQNLQDDDWYWGDAVQRAVERSQTIDEVDEGYYRELVDDNKLWNFTIKDQNHYYGRIGLGEPKKEPEEFPFEETPAAAKELVSA